MRCAIVQDKIGIPSETFLAAQAAHLPADVTVIHGIPPMIGDTPIFSTHWLIQYWRRLRKRIYRLRTETMYASEFCSLFRRLQPDVVLAQYGPVGVRIERACRQLNIPLVVHFHGYDASSYSYLEHWKLGYQEVFQSARAIVAVSKVMKQRLIDLGAPADKIHHVVYGIDVERFQGGNPADSPPQLLSVGRFVEKKAPLLTLRAFRDVVRQVNNAQLRMIGDGDLLDVCKQFVRTENLIDHVTFLGAQPHSVVQEEMRSARAFVQHSVTAASGDMEGTPVSILEAGATGLPVIATRHAGIPDVVLEEETGLLVDEHDVDGMAQCMLRVLRDPEFAGQLGQRARQHVQSHYTQSQSIDKLYRVLEFAASQTQQ